MFLIFQELMLACNSRGHLISSISDRLFLAKRTVGYHRVVHVLMSRKPLPAQGYEPNRPSLPEEGTNSSMTVVS